MDSFYGIVFSYFCEKTSYKIKEFIVQQWADAKRGRPKIIVSIITIVIAVLIMALHVFGVNGRILSAVLTIELALCVSLYLINLKQRTMDIDSRMQRVLCATKILEEFLKGKDCLNRATLEMLIRNCEETINEQTESERLRNFFKRIWAWVWKILGVGFSYYFLLAVSGPEIVTDFELETIVRKICELVGQKNMGALLLTFCIVVFWAGIIGYCVSSAFDEAASGKRHRAKALKRHLEYLLVQIEKDCDSPQISLPQCAAAKSTISSERCPDKMQSTN